MIVDVNAFLLVEKKKKNNNKSIVTTNKEIIEVSLVQEGNLGEVVEASSIMSEIGRKHVEIPSEVMAKPLVPIVEEIETQLVEEEAMQNVPTNVDMEKERIQEPINEEVILEGKDDRPHNLEDEDVEIIAVKGPFHQQLERELLMQPEEDEQTNKNQQEGEVQQIGEELHVRTLVVMDLQWQNVVNDMAKHLVVMENGASTNEDLDVVAEQLEMLAQRIRKNNGEVQELQKKNEKMAKQLEETQKQLTNQVEKALYEKKPKDFKRRNVLAEDHNFYFKR